MFVRVLPNSASRSSLFLFIQARSIRSQTRKKKKNEPTNWESNHSFVESNPLLSLIDRRCKCVSHLKQIQSQMTVSGLISDPFASSRLVAFCALSESRDFEYCLRLLFASDTTNAFSWNTAIRGLSESESPIEALVLYKTMFEDGRGSKPDRFTYPLLLKVCANLGSSFSGFQVLGHAVMLGFDSHVFVHNAAIHMLASCGDLRDARKMFDESPVRDLVSWNSLINGYSRAGIPNKALKMYGEMAAEKVDPDEVTMIGLVSSCSKLGDLNKGREFHRLIESNGLNLTVPLCNTLVDMYVKCGDLETARRIFDGMKSKTAFSWAAMISGYAISGIFDEARKLLDEMPERNPVPWNAMIGGFVQAKRGREALDLFHEMQRGGILPDENTVIGILSACSQLGALETGVWIHHYVEKSSRLSSNVAVRTTLVHMYAKCGEIEKALQVFDETPERNALTWTAIICGLASHGRAREALARFEAMIRSNLAPDEVTFLGILSACCHGGLVEEGRKYFSEMGPRFGIRPNKRHYSCAVDLLGRAGRLEEAERLIEGMGFEPDAAVWGALFSACRARGDVATGERAASRLLELDPGDSGNYVLLANMYKEAGMFEKAEKVRRLMRERRVVKIPGCSSVELDGVVSEFVVRDGSHPDSERIYECLARLTSEIEIGCGDDHTFGDEFLFGF